MMTALEGRMGDARAEEFRVFVGHHNRQGHRLQGEVHVASPMNEHGQL